ncbi:receptor expression-enhancing protein 1 isoform X1 [Hydra vulgaris]|uniref:receptor expression-enhancing protein 1 isoform X1 n=1 Tax=Hydra vulgaris TaxID=6087 RepID=UPI000640C40B|nr:receptor expression-enhancing protein 1 isoform X2 [Hydra vulgaris]
MVSALLSKVIMMVFGTLYPAYRSYKAVKNKDVREYVKWMMYWIIFAFFITAETFADVFISWLPLYYEVKIVFIIWLLSPATKGSSILYRKFVHPRLQKHEKEIDHYIARAQKSSYATLVDVGKKGFNVATNTLMKTAITGQYQILESIRRYNSMQELGDADHTDASERKQSSRYNNYQPPININYNPENDIDMLQSQYEPLVDVREEEKNLQRAVLLSQSEMSYSHESIQKKTYDEEQLAPQISNDLYTSVSTTSYSSNTLPRVRKSKKPIYESNFQFDKDDGYNDIYSSYIDVKSNYGSFKSAMIRTDKLY